MKVRATLIAATLATASLFSSTSQAALQGRDLNGSQNSIEAYYDTALDITWLADASYILTSGYIQNLGYHDYSDGGVTSTDASYWVDQLGFHDSVNQITYHDWRLPTVRPVNGASFNLDYSSDGSTDVGYNITSPQSELSYMFNVNLGNPGYRTSAGVDSGCYVDSGNTCLDNVGPFSNLSPGVFWSDTSAEDGNGYGGMFVFWAHYGSQQLWADNGDHLSAWAVSSGDVGIAAVPEADTWAMLLVGLGLVGVAVRHRHV